MDSIVLKSPQKFAKLPLNAFSGGSISSAGRNHRFSVSANAHKYPSSTFSPPPSQKIRLRLRLRGTLLPVAAARKDDNENEPNDAIEPFPEPVLLKEEKLEEDGRVLPDFADAEERELWEALDLQLESDLDADRMRHYEVVYLIHENHKEEVEQVNLKVREFLEEKKAKIWRFNDWGMRRLAYAIQKSSYAYYILMDFETEAKWINDFKSMLDTDERVIRHLVIKKDKAETKDCPPPPEFHTLRAQMSDYDEDEEDEDEEYDEEDMDEEYDEEGDDEEEDDEDDDEEEEWNEEDDINIVYVDDDDDVNHGETSLDREKQVTESK